MVYFENFMSWRPIQKNTWNATNKKTAGIKDLSEKRDIVIQKLKRAAKYQSI